MYLASIHLYPLKAGRAVDLSKAQVEPWGLAGDRRWLLVDPGGRFISQRTESALALVTARYEPASPGTGADAAVAAITVTAAGFPPLTILAPSQAAGAPMLSVTIWGSTVLAAAAGPAADKWFSRYLGRPVQLVYLDDPTRREVDPGFGAASDR
ncbi:MAG: MOSC N-terminal beta barrel domain-containing protein, partial [Streptosporangiaceae bacterium]